MHVFSARAQTIESALHVARSALRLPFPTDNAYNRAHNRGLSALRPDGGSGGSQTGRGGIQHAIQWDGKDGTDGSRNASVIRVPAQRTSPRLRSVSGEAGGSRGLEPRGNRSTRTGGATLAAPRHGDTAGSDLELVRQRACTSAGRCGHAAIGSLKQPELVLIVAATFDELYRQAGGDRRGR